MRRGQIPSLAMLLFLPAAAHAGELGKLDFQVTARSEAAKQNFRRGVLALHSFWYDEAFDAFKASVEAEPTFAMGYFGEAMSKAKLLWRDDDVPAAREALAKAGPLKEGLTQKERAWLDAAEALFGEGDQTARRAAYARKLELMHEADPKDDEIATFLAVALLAESDLAKWNEVGPRVKAAALALEVYARNPDHPGAAHYIIHAFDMPDLAVLGLPAARRYASIAPEAHHARHMPSHIFTQLGMWKDALASCEAAWQASEAWIARRKLTPDKRDHHSLEWIMNIDFELGRKKDAARALATFADSLKMANTPPLRAHYANIVHAYLVRSGDWTQADELLRPLETLEAPKTETAASAPAPQSCGAHASNERKSDRPPWAVYEREAIALSRASAAAHRHQLVEARKYLDAAKQTEKEYEAYDSVVSGKALWAAMQKLREHERSGIMAVARGDYRALAQELDKAAAIVDAWPQTEGATQASLRREQLGEVYLQLHRPQDAAKQFTAVLQHHPNRARSLLGRARAFELAGDAAHAREDYRRLLAVWDTADADMPGLEEAKRVSGAEERAAARAQSP